MKGYEYTILAALVTIVMCSLGAPSPRRRGVSQNSMKRGMEVRGLSCKTSPASFQETHTFFIRSGCKESGYLTVVRDKVLIQTSGLDPSHRDAEFVKETCMNETSTSLHLQSSYSMGPLVRYKHRNTDKYICFTRKGRVRTVSALRVERKGVLCMFRENLLESRDPSSSLDTSLDSSTFHTIQSAHRMGWFMGFNPRKGATIKDRKPHKGSLPRKGATTLNPKINRCDFRFHSGAHGPKDNQNKHSGLFAKIPTPMVSKAVRTGQTLVSRIGDIVPKISAPERQHLAQQRKLIKNSAKFQKKIRHPNHKKFRPSRKSKNLRKKKRKKAMTSPKRRQTVL